MSTITDGTSHTFLMGERTGGNRFYSGMREMVVPAPYNGLQGGGWGDPLNGEHWLAGTNRNPTFPAPEGTCAINCSNLRGGSFHAFHPGGCHFLKADGSVQFVSESVAAFPG